ncbi:MULTISPECIES: transporter substrate-binding domain-containing protein [unclassified Pseudomonas]|uniref:transporter substrate-binding domain-containing protein n=1 Tax=unclassified Pseudomonas TaxID=196821 RepID=UPI000D37A343|nr:MULTISPECIES: transporter substrate-binding domain-containing protein [unclassified Pseudomonas]RAU49589.1 ArtI protein [Pseudomonas sp. RIT 409]RAU55672.1 ArtI protein [Pseudomonas sp. RIT 412]
MKACFTSMLLVAVAGVAHAQASESASHLDTVLQRGELAVCTTGDYKPYTFHTADGQYEGIDIEMAQSLAQSLGVKLQWVPTTWKTLMTDFTAGKCDIAMGGISVTLERQKKAFFSNTLDVDGKIPLVRCEDESKYQTIEQINQADVRLIEPQGGTNEAFARAHLPAAKLDFHDNKTIFQQLLDKKADVMITDASEALYQQKRLPGLCAVNPSRAMQYGEKAYLLPRDDVSWKAYVDQWLHLSKATGAYQKVVGEWLAVPGE